MIQIVAAPQRLDGSTVSRGGIIPHDPPSRSWMPRQDPRAPDSYGWALV